MNPLFNGEIRHFGFNIDSLNAQSDLDDRIENWPVVYILHDQKNIYIGETASAIKRLKQHLNSDDKKQLKVARIAIYDKFNASVCHDLESNLIKWFAGDGKFKILNRNDGIQNLNYPDREMFQPVFKDIFQKLKDQELFNQSFEEIENGDLFKLSPFKSLNKDQEDSIYKILSRLISVIENDEKGSFVIEGAPGTGKTVIATFLIKLLSDLRHDRLLDDDKEMDKGRFFRSMFTPKKYSPLKGLSIGFVIPQQSLRKSVSKVFKSTFGLEHICVMSPFELGESTNIFDLLFVDEAHRLNLRANQPTGALNNKFKNINVRLFGQDDLKYTQLDWVIAKSTHQIFLLDTEQCVRTADLSKETIKDLCLHAKRREHYFQLKNQMRVLAGEKYIEWTRDILVTSPQKKIELNDYDLRFFDDFKDMYALIKQRDKDFGLSRVVAGYAWEWKSRKEPSSYDIELDGYSIRWNSTVKDWINTPGSLDEMGSIHTVQGYDLNYVGVVIGPEIYKDSDSQEICFNREMYFDKKGMENNPRLGVNYSDNDILAYVRNIYSVLLTRGIRGTYIYVVNPCLRQHIKEAVEFLLAK